MLLAADDLADDHAIETRTERLDSFHFEAGHGETPIQLGTVDRWIDEFA